MASVEHQDGLVQHAYLPLESTESPHVPTHSGTLRLVCRFNAATGHTHERSSVFRVARLCSPHARAITASSPICLRLRHVGRAGAGSGLREHAHTHTHARTQVHGRRRERERTTEGDAGERERERGGDRVSTSQHIGQYARHATFYIIRAIPRVKDKERVGESE